MLKSARVKKGYSQEYLSGILGVSSSHISRWENGQTEMTLCQILKYASKVGICSTEMFEVLARNGQPRPLPMVEMRIEVFTEEAFNKLSQLLIELGTEQATGEIITVESLAYQELLDRLNRIEQYVERTSHLIQDIDDELEMTTKDLIETLNVSESTLYRWRKKQLLRYRYTESGDVRYFFKSIIIAVKCNRLRVSGMRNDEVLGRLNRFKDNLIMSSCLNSKNR